MVFGQLVMSVQFCAEAHCTALRLQATHTNRPKPGPSRAQARLLEIWKSGTWKSGIWDPKKVKNKKSQNPTPFCPKGRQSLDE